VRLTCSSHISSEQNGGRFSCRGARAAEKISEVGFLYGNPGRPAQHHTNHKPAFHSAHWYCDNVFRSIGFRWCVPPKGLLPTRSSCPYLPRQVSRQTGLNRLVSPPSLCSTLLPLVYIYGSAAIPYEQTEQTEQTEQVSSSRSRYRKSM
jgi:hypothetical protein